MEHSNSDSDEVEASGYNGNICSWLTATFVTTQIEHLFTSPILNIIQYSTSSYPKSFLKTPKYLACMKKSCKLGWFIEPHEKLGIRRQVVIRKSLSDLFRKRVCKVIFFKVSMDNIPFRRRPGINILSGKNSHVSCNICREASIVYYNMRGCRVVGGSSTPRTRNTIGSYLSPKSIIEKISYQKSQNEENSFAEVSAWKSGTRINMS